MAELRFTDRMSDSDALVNSDPAAVPDPALLVGCLQDGFDEILKLA